MNELDKILHKLNENIEDDEEYIKAEHDAVQQYCVQILLERYAYSEISDTSILIQRNLQYCEDHNYKMTDDEIETIRAFGYEESFDIWVEFEEEVSENEL